jgi:hypothetical protein
MIEPLSSSSPGCSTKNRRALNRRGVRARGAVAAQHALLRALQQEAAECIAGGQRHRGLQRGHGRVSARPQRRLCGIHRYIGAEGGHGMLAASKPSNRFAALASRICAGGGQWPGSRDASRVLALDLLARCGRGAQAGQRGLTAGAAMGVHHATMDEDGKLVQKLHDENRIEGLLRPGALVGGRDPRAHPRANLPLCTGPGCRLSACRTRVNSARCSHRCTRRTARRPRPHSR